MVTMRSGRRIINQQELSALFLNLYIPIQDQPQEITVLMDDLQDPYLAIINLFTSGVLQQGN